MKIVKIIARGLLALLPWSVRRPLLCRAFGYQIAPSARISSLAWVYPEKLTMHAGARIGPLTVAVHLRSIEMGSFATIGRRNWITAHPAGSVKHFTHRADRDPSLKMGEHSAITKSHLIDCTDSISIGEYTTIAGYGSQLITHGINYEKNYQDCQPISIGAYCLVGSRIIVLTGSTLPDFSILGAGAVLTKKYTKNFQLYAGVPAKPVKSLTEGSAYFSRSSGFVN